MNYDEFASANPTLDPIESIRKFSNQTRSDLLAAGQLTDETDREITAAALERAVADGHIATPTSEEEVHAAAAGLFSPPAIHNDIVNLAARKASEEGDDEIAKRLRTYTALQAPAVKANFASMEEYDAALSAAKTDAESLLDESRIADTKRYALKNGMAKIATYTENGKLRVDAAPDAMDLDGKTVAEYVKAYPQFADPSAALTISRNLTKNADLGLSPAQLVRKAELQAGVTKLAESDPALKTHVDEIVRGFAMGERGTGQTVVDTLGSVAAVAGSTAAEMLSAGYRGLTGQPAAPAQPVTVSKTPEALAEYLYGNTELGRQYSKQELLEVSKDLAIAGGVDSLGYDDASPAASIRKLSTGQLVMPTSMMANKQLFDTALSKSGASDFQKQLAVRDRESKLDAMGKQMLPILANADDDVLDFYNEKKAAGWTDGSILESLSSNVKYNGFLNRAENFSLAALKTVTDLIPTIGKALPDGGLIENVGYGINKKINDEMAANQLLAKQFGKDMGWVQQLTEQVPQLVADIAISRGAGRAAGAASRGAALVAPQTMAKLELFRTLKLPSLVGKEVAEGIASKLALDPNTAGWLISQGARTFGSTYVSTRSALETATNPDGSPKYTADQIDTLATETGILNAAAGNAITYAFNKIGGGRFAGAETLAAGKGFSTRQLKGYYDDLVKGVAAVPREIAGEIKLDSFENFVRSSTSFWARPLGKALAGGTGEAGEEFVQTVVEDTLSAIATGREVDLIEAGKQAALAASLGFALGGGAEVVSHAERQLFRDPQFQRADFEEQVLRGTIDTLRASNSPLTAAFLETQLGTARARKVAISDQFKQATQDYRDIIAARESYDKGEVDVVAEEPEKQKLLPAPPLVSKQMKLKQVEQKLLAATPEEEMTDAQRAQLEDVRARITSVENEIEIADRSILMGGEAGPPVRPPVVRDNNGQIEWTFLDEVESESRIPVADTAPTTVAAADLPANERASLPDTGTMEFPSIEPEPTVAQRVHATLAARFPNVVKAIDSLRKSKDRSLALQFSNHIASAETADDELHGLQVERAAAVRARNNVASLLTTEQKKADMRAAADEQQLLLEAGAMASETPLKVKPVADNILEYTRQRAELDTRIADLDTRIRDSVSRRDAGISAVGAMFETRERTIEDALAELKTSINEKLEDAAEKIAKVREPKPEKPKKAAKTEPEPTAEEETEVTVAALETSVKAEIAADIADAIENWDLPAETVAEKVEEIRTEAEKTTGKGEKAKKAAAKLAALMPSVADVEAARKADTGELRDAASTIKFDWKGDIINKTEEREGKRYLKNTDSADGFATAGGFDLFNRLLDGGVVPPRDALNGMLKSEDYAYPQYVNAFSNSLREAIESRWPVITQPESERVVRDDEDESPDIERYVRDTFKSTAGRMHARLQTLVDSIKRLNGLRNVTVTEKALSEWRLRRAAAAKKLAKLEADAGAAVAKQVAELSYQIRAWEDMLPAAWEKVDDAAGRVPLARPQFLARLDQLLAEGRTMEADRLIKTGPASDLQVRIWEASPESLPLERIEAARAELTSIEEEIRHKREQVAKLRKGRENALDKVSEAEAELRKLDSSKPYTESSLKAELKSIHAEKRAVEKRIAEAGKKGDRFKSVPASYSSRLRVKRGLTKLSKRDGDTRRMKLPLIELDGRRAGFFTNDPRTTADQLDEGYSVFVPKNLRKSVNDAIKVGRNGYVKAVKLTDKTVKFAGDASPFYEKPYESEELQPHNVQAILALPAVPPSLTYLLGKTAVSGKQSFVDDPVPVDEQTYIDEAYIYLLNHDVAAVRRMKDHLMIYNADYNDLASSIVLRYIRTIREFAIGQQVLDMQIEKASPERIAGFLWSKFSTGGRKRKQLAPDFERELRKKFGKKFGKEASADLLLRTYGAQLANEVAAGTKVAAVSDDELEALLGDSMEGEKAAKSFNPARFAGGRPPALTSVAQIMFRNYRNALRIRRPVGNMTDSLDAAIAAGLPSDADLQQATEYLTSSWQASELESAALMPDAEPETGEAVTPQSELERVITAIDSNPESRAAFETIATAYGIDGAAKLSTRELVDLFRDELSPLRKQAEANLRERVSKEAEAIYADLRRSSEFNAQVKLVRKISREASPEIAAEVDMRAELREELRGLDDELAGVADAARRKEIAARTLPRRKELREMVAQSVAREKELRDAQDRAMISTSPSSPVVIGSAEDEAMRREAEDEAFVRVRSRRTEPLFQQAVEAEYTGMLRGKIGDTTVGENLLRSSPAEAERLRAELRKRAEQVVASNESRQLSVVQSYLRPLVDLSLSTKFAAEVADARLRKSATRKAYREAVRGTRTRVEGDAEITARNARSKMRESLSQFGAPARGDTVLAMDKYNYGTYYGVALEGKNAGMASVYFENRETGASSTVFLELDDLFTVSRPKNDATGKIVGHERLKSLVDSTVITPPTIGPVSEETRKFAESPEPAYQAPVPTEEEQQARVRALLEAGIRPSETINPTPVVTAEAVITLPDGQRYTRSQLERTVEYLQERTDSEGDESLAEVYAQRLHALRNYLETGDFKNPTLHSIAHVPVMSTNDIVAANDSEIAELGLTKDPSSLFTALENVPADLQPLAKLLLKHRARMTGVRFQIVTAPNTGWAGKYLPDSRTIVINRAASNGRGVADALVHEMLHDLLFTAVRSDDPAAKRLVAKLESLRSKALAKAQADGETDPQLLAGLSSVDELAAYVFTSKDFQRKLHELDGPRNFLQKIIDAICSFLTGNPLLIRGTMNDLIELAGYSSPRPYGMTLSESAAMLMSVKIPAGRSKRSIPPSLVTKIGEDIGYNEPRSAVEIGDRIADSQFNQTQKALWSTLRPLLEKAGTHTVFANRADISPESRFRFAGVFLPSRNLIGLDISAVAGFGNPLPKVFLHEAVHALSSARIAESAELKNVVGNLIAHARKHMSDSDARAYGFRNEKEFVSETFSSPSFQKILKSIPATDAKAGNLFDQFVAFIKKVVGVSGKGTLLEQALEASVVAIGIGDVDTLIAAGYSAERATRGTPKSSAGVSGVGIRERMIARFEARKAASARRSVAEDENGDFYFIEDRTPESGFVYDESLPTAFASREDSDKVFVNPTLAAELVAELNDRSARNVLQALHNHEAAHIATFKTLTTEQRDHIANTLPESGMWDVADRYYAQVEPDADKRYARMQADRDSGALTNSKIAYEWLRSRVEILNSGYTSEEELAFWRGNPSLLSVFAHYLRGYVNRLSAMVNSPADSRTAGILNRVARAHQKLIGGDVVETVDDAIAKIAEGEASFVFAMPVAGEYDARSAVGKWVGKYLGTGDAPAQVKRLLDSLDSHNRFGVRVVERFNKEIGRHIKNGLITEENRAAMMEALGGHIEVDRKKVAALQKRTDAERAAAEDEFRKTNRLAADRVALAEKQDAITLRYNDEFNKLWVEADDGTARRRQEEALSKLPPAVADTLRRMTAETAKNARWLVEDPNMPLDLRATIAANMGVHVVRTYRSFTQAGYWKMVKGKKTVQLGNEMVDFNKIYDNAMKVFTGFAEKQLNEKYADAGMTTAALKARVNSEVSDVAERMLDSFIDRYDEMATGLMLGSISPKDIYEAMTGDPSSLALHQRSTNALKAEMSHYLARKDVPEWMRELMGEVKDPVEAAVRSFVTVSTLAGNQLFLSKLREEGLAGGWLTHDPASKNDEREYVKLAEPTSAGVSVLGGLYGPPELRHVLDTHFKQAAGLAESSADAAIRESVGALRKAAGTAMGVKTLLSVGFIPRNALSDFLFFAPFQGLAINPFNSARWKASSHAAFSGIATDAEAEARIEKYVRLGVVESDARSSALRQQVRGYSENPAQTLAKMGGIAAGLQSANVLEKATGMAGKPLEIMAKASSTVANHLKIMVFEQELEWLQKAYGNDPDYSTPDQYGITRMEREAADKTNRTTQTRSATAPIVTSFSRSPLGSLFAPFVSFKAEVARIMYNTPKLAFEEMNSGNEVIRKRGRNRMVGMLTTATILPFTVEAMIRVAFAGLGKAFGDDEDLMAVLASAMQPRTHGELERDEALRKGLPEWQQNNPVSFAVTGSKVRTVDLAYINPFSLYMSPFLRSIEHIRTDNEDKITGTFVDWTAKQLIGEQILSGAITDAFDNRDDRGNLIATPDMGFMEALFTRAGYALKAAYMPPSAVFAGRVLGGTGGSQKATDEAARNRNRVELITGELFGIRPRAYDLEGLYETGMRRENAKLRDVRSATSVATSNYSVEEGRIADVAARNNRARVNRGTAMKQMLDEFGKLGLDSGRMISLAREAGISKEAVKLAAAGYVQGYSPSLADKRMIFERRQEVDGRGAESLMELAAELKKWGPLIPLR